jgi:uncharacterized beta-barrel protein YwiB (DUF1934 family)
MKYLITIKDTHIIDGEKESSELAITGSLRFNDKGYKIRYKEGDTGYDGCFVTLSVEGDKVTMTRLGAFSAEMIIEKGKRHICAYATPAGIMNLGVYANRVSSEMTEDGGVLEFSYSLDVDGEYLSENHLVVTIQK